MPTKEIDDFGIVYYEQLDLTINEIPRNGPRIYYVLDDKDETFVLPMYLLNGKTKDRVLPRDTKILGRVHRDDGPAVIYHSALYLSSKPALKVRTEYNNYNYYLHGRGFLKREEWFVQLNSEQKHNAIWNF